MSQTCAKWGCKTAATFEKPLCYDHWLEWDAWDLEECNRCHWFYADGFDSVAYYEGEWEKEFPYLCTDCLGIICEQAGEPKPYSGYTPKDRPISVHAPLRHLARYVYILKLVDYTFYVGQTTDLVIRLQEHREGKQRQTRGKNPKLVYFEDYVGMKQEVDEREKELTDLNQTGFGQRRLRVLIERFRAPLKLLDLDA
ncbi:MAG: hypothetical protein HW403_579 [Dehalococcoidia bacterium]|nr:hypothetical protein [Dehalococcoidia bacterium]